MREICREKGGRKRFEIPPDVVQISYCRDSGMLTDDACLFDPRGARTQTGWFVKGTEPHNTCTCHILCQSDAEHGGVSHGFCPVESQKKIALIRVERHFPKQVLVTDAQYVWRGDPQSLPPNQNATGAYFEQGLSDFCGRSYTQTPFNRSCQVHTEQEEESVLEDEIRRVPWWFFSHAE